MISLDTKKGFSLTLIAVFVTIVAAALVPAFCNVMFFTTRAPATDALFQQAYYNANCGVEYAMFIIEHRDPLDPATWPQGNSIPCNFPAGAGNFTITITSDPVAGFNIRSIGTAGTMTATINRVHVAAGRIEEWQ
ncbi:MAG: hypothetical protein Q8R14_02240 [Candidatus Omnitrophota bacterium]|nr:hypothetical protein [Candidatus Omnitrophota bacterium]